MRRKVTRMLWVFPHARPILDRFRSKYELNAGEVPSAWRVEVLLHRRSFERSTGYPRGMIRVSFRSDLHPTMMRKIVNAALPGEILGLTQDTLSVSFRHTAGRPFRQLAAEKCRQVFQAIGLRVGDCELPEVGDCNQVWRRAPNDQGGIWVDEQGARFWNVTKEAPVEASA
jgi:hypothetical protein